MGRFLLPLLLTSTVVLALETLPSRSTKIDKNTVLVLWGTRHGNRHPEKFLEENPRTWGFEGNTELTSWGKKQAYGLGRELRSFVGKLVDSNYNTSQVKYYSSSANRCQMTLQTAVAGFHEPIGWADWEHEKHEYWSPVPYTIDDKLVRMYALSDEECPNNAKVWDPVSKDTLPALAKKAQEEKEFIKYLAEKTGWDFKHLGVVADLADNLIEIDLYNAKYPEWISKPKLKGYTGDKMKKKILEFSEIHQIGCADYDPCGHLMSGVWLSHLLKSIDDASKSKGPQVIGYASHTEVTLSAMKQMGYKKNELTTSAGFVIEFRLKPSPSVRLLNHDPNPIDKHVIYKADLVPKLAGRADKDGFILLKDFIEYVKPKAITDWKKACGVSDKCKN